MSITFPTTQVPDPLEAPGLNWGVIAPGGIARKFVGTMHGATASRLVTVLSRSRERAAAFAEEFAADASPATAYESLSEFLAHEGLDAVYLASPHGYHYEMAKPVIEAGIPIVVEKAFTLNARQARELFDIARDKGVFVQEAMWSRFLPHYDIVKQLVDSGAIGEVTSVAADHGQYFPFDEGHRLFAPELGGGALLDLGVYPISFAHHVLGNLTKVSAQGILTAQGVDDTVSIHARAAGVGRARAAEGGAIPSGADEASRTALVSIESSLSARTGCTAKVVGREGRIDVEGRFYGPTRLTLTRFASTRHGADEIATWDYSQVGHQIALEVNGHDSGFAYEIAAAARAISEGRLESAEMPWSATLEVMEIMDEVRRQIGVVYPAER